jgi:hypothetical protein
MGEVDMKYRKPKVQPSTLKISYGKLPGQEPDLIYSWGLGVDGKESCILHEYMGKQRWVNNEIEVSMFEKLEKAGYDLKTLKFSIQKKTEDGTCCYCGYNGTVETPCEESPDKSHCVHWWDGPEDKFGLGNGEKNRD